MTTRHMASWADHDPVAIWRAGSSKTRSPYGDLNTCLKTWGGRAENVNAAQTTLLTRAKANSLAQLGKYTGEGESEEAKEDWSMMTLQFTFWSRKPFGYCPGSSKPDRCTTVTIRTPAGLSGWSTGKDELWYGQFGCLDVVPALAPFRMCAGRSGTRLGQSDRYGWMDEIRPSIGSFVKSSKIGNETESSSFSDSNVEMVGKDELWYGQFGCLDVVPALAPFWTCAGRSGTRLGQYDRYSWMDEPRLNCSQRPDLHAELVPCTDPWTGAHQNISEPEVLLTEPEWVAVVVKLWVIGETTQVISRVQEISPQIDLVEISGRIQIRVMIKER
ncbi:hypothetical protein DY000_02021120 [Brassica cretica]|uniref:fructose-bisphosphate aldolase n=1 Tax=Brassica cretica TaxID=69181 RepID=A0ABQ7E534_BRACR|nr:hypothetical protein DY000_02021120 [Brassica cretica]